MDELRRALERRRVSGTVGYIGDVAASELAGSPTGREDYFLAQFALVPWVLEARAPEREWVVANLRAAAIVDRMPRGYRVSDECGDGVFLLRRIEPLTP